MCGIFPGVAEFEISVVDIGEYSDDKGNEWDQVNETDNEPGRHAQDAHHTYELFQHQKKHL